MKRSKSVRDFDFYIDEYMYNCQSRKLRKKTLQAYEQTLRLFERWCMDEMGITSPEEVREATFRRYICDMQERGKYTFFSVEESAIGYTPNKRRDYAHPLSVTSINNYIRNLKAFFTWYLESISSVKALAVRTGVSEHLCDMLFQEHLQVSSTRYIKEYRWEKACQMLTQTRKSVSEISAECGMNNSYFSKKFREETGLTPLEYRRVYYRNKADKE